MPMTTEQGVFVLPDGICNVCNMPQRIRSEPSPCSNHGQGCGGIVIPNPNPCLGYQRRLYSDSLCLCGHSRTFHQVWKPYRQREGDQPLPKAGDVDVIENTRSAVAAYASARGMGDIGEQICVDLEKRAALGVVRYGKRLQTNNGRDARRDQYEELCDALN